MNTATKRRQRGAALLMLLTIFGVLGAFFAMRTLGSASQQITQITDATAALSQAKDALIGFAASHSQTGAPGTRPYLPCPDKRAAAGLGTANDGREDRNVVTGVCVVQEGNLPWVDLGLAGTDSWSSRLRYSVTAAFSNSVSGMQLTSVGTLTVNNAAGAALATALPLVVISHGPNRWGATGGTGVIVTLPPAANVNERENTDGDTVFVSSPPVAAGGAGGEYDDLTAWLTTAILLARMQQAGKL
ncbi:MAG: hypothetical protein OEL20_11220 [Sulfuritalea sp.]|nr:hypothetical protein [Sulfuritalea sp.]